MKNLFFILFVMLVLFVGTLAVQAEEYKVTITEPKNKEVLQSPVKVCMEVQGLVVENENNGVNEGKGHHHILFTALPFDLTKPIGRKEIHLVDGSTCLMLKLDVGMHAIITLFAYGNHVPYLPAIKDMVKVKIK